MIDFYLSCTRNIKAAKRFLGKALKSVRPWAYPNTINTDKVPTFGSPIDELKKEGKCPRNTVNWQVKYLNNIVEADHGKLKRLINPVRGFKNMKMAYATIKGFVNSCAYTKKGRLDVCKYERGLIGEIRLIERQCDI